MNQYYEAEVVSEYVIRGNTAVLKCNIPSFVADFVKVEAWVGSDESEYLPTQDIGNASSTTSHLYIFLISIPQIQFLVIDTFCRLLFVNFF